MSTFAVGDIQGCYNPLIKALGDVGFNQSKDTLLCVGDLVNRGPDSLKVLRFLKNLGNQCVTVLGNHDIHFLAMYYGIRMPKATDTLQQVLDAPDVDDLALWLRNKPLVVQLKQSKTILCHAGIYPGWSLKKALGLANEVANVFADEKRCVKLLKNIYSNQPSKWSDALGKTRRHRFIINAFTRMRFCSPKGHLNLKESSFKGKRRKNRLPWFEMPNASLNDYRVIFGHWSALGLLNTKTHLCLDTGYVWGRELTLAKIPKGPKARPIKTSKLTVIAAEPTK
jgi:bis(5'-nucleosyl)-tetraphosphatase (symmetrical)